jgi:16S rRNA (guanine(1405)-N(7))-methyltransferase
MTTEVVERVRRSARYRDVDPALVTRLAAEELPKARTTDDAVKRVKRRLHQAVGAFRGARAGTPSPPWNSLGDPRTRAACADVMRGHASSRERLPHLDRFYSGIWDHTGTPRRLLDLGCGLNPLALPWMDLGDAMYLASDVDERPLATVRRFLGAVGQPHLVEARDLVVDPPSDEADVALLLKLVTTLDRQDPDAAAHVLRSLRVRHAVVSFAARSLGGRVDRRARAYRERLDRLAADAARVRTVAEASVPNELVFVLELEPIDG